MRSLPHITIGCGAIWAGSRLLRTGKTDPEPVNDATSAHNSGENGPASAGEIDYRLVAAGSLLPDFVDRAQRALFRIRRSSPDQHFLGHTLLLNVPLLLAGMQFWRRSGDPRLLAVAAAAMAHLLVDPVVRSPSTLFWPLFGLDFPAARGLSPRITAVTQIAAAAAIVMTAVVLQRRNRLDEFITNGRL